MGLTAMPPFQLLLVETRLAHPIVQVKETSSGEPIREFTNCRLM